MNLSPLRRFVLSAGVALLLALGSPVMASVYLEFANNGATVQVNQGGSFQVTLNLVTTAEDVVGFDYYASVGALLDGKVTLTGRDLVTSSFIVPTEFNATVLALPAAILELHGGNVRNDLTLGAVTNNTFTPVGAGTWQVAVLTFSLSPTAPIGMHSFGTMNLPNAGWFGEDFEQHDFDSQGSLTLNIVAVPEPASGMLLLAGLGVLVFARRRKARFPLAALGVAVAAVLCVPSAAHAQTYEYQQISLPNGNALNYRIAQPLNYVGDGSQKYPLVIYWHGNGDFDYEQFVLGNPMPHNTAQMVDDGQFAFMSPSNQAIFPCFLVLMQRGTKNGGDNDTEAFCAALTDYLVANRNVDPDRVIITGLSGGGGRTLACAYSNTNKYAAIVPLSTIFGGSGDAATLANRIKDIPAWFFHAADDRTVNISSSDSLVRELRKVGARPIFTRLDFGDHSIGLWQRNYATPALVPWLAMQRRGQAQQADPATVTIRLPTTDPTIITSNTNVTFKGLVEIKNTGSNLILDPMVTTISGTKITTSATTSFGLSGLAAWTATSAVTISTSGTTRLLAVARGTSWSTQDLGYTYYSDTLLATYVANGDTTAPVVQITSPTTLATWTTKAETLDLAGTATDAVGVKAVEWDSNRGGLGAATGTNGWSVTAIPLVTGTNVLTVYARDASGNIGQKSLTVIREGSLPVDNSLWTGSNIGNTGLSGNFVNAQGTITIRGSGSGMWGTDNNYYFVHQPISGDTVLIARLKSQEGSPSGENFAGWFISETISSTSRYFLSGFGGGSRGVMRAHYGPTDTWGGSQNKFGISPPYWIKLVRQGNSFSSYVSATGTGTDWTQIDTTQNIGMGQNAYVGFVVGSAQTGVLKTAVFDNISIGNGTAPILVSAASRMAHGAAGNFDLDLPLAGTTGVECRRGPSPGTLSVRLAFDRALASGSATVSSGVATVSGTPTVSGTALVVNLTGVTDGQTITINASNVLPQGTGPAGSGKVSLRVLSGDTNASGGVTTADVAKVQANVGKPLAAANFNCDIDANGTIDVTDYTLAKAKLGTTLP